MRRIKVVVPVATDLWNDGIRAELKRWKNPDTDIDVVNIEHGPESIECNYDIAWAELFAVREAEEAKDEGYDGVILYCFGDPGLRAAKEALEIPVVGIGEASIHMASLLGNRFSIIAAGPSKETVLGHLEPNLKVYGFDARCASIGFLNIPVLKLGEDKAITIQRIVEEADRSIKEDGADVVVLGCGSMLGVANKVSQQVGVPVVVPGVAALKICEDLIELGFSQSKRYFAKPPRKLRKL